MRPVIGVGAGRCIVGLGFPVFSFRVWVSTQGPGLSGCRVLCSRGLTFNKGSRVPGLGPTSR